MTTQTEALKLALDALENHTAIKHPQQIHYRDKAITAIKEALAQPEQEPVIGTKTWFEDGKVVTQHLTAKDIYKDPEQPEQEPVAWYHQEEYKTHFTSIPSQDMIENGYWQPLYAAPPQRTWVGLTPDEIRGISLASGESLFSAIMFTHDKLKEKNT